MRVIFLFLFSLFLTQPLNAWWSKGGDGSTHDIISARAIALVNAGEYPDIAKFSDTIRQATASQENDEIAHGKDPEHPDAGRFNGGDFERWWRESQASYERAEFLGSLNAYFRIGSMAHLVQDQAVPAHAANIYHGIYLGELYADPDDLEMYVGLFGSVVYPNNIAAYYGDNPLAYYYDANNPGASLILNTQSQLPSWKYPVGGLISSWQDRQYWRDNAILQYKYLGQPFFPNSNFETRLVLQPRFFLLR